MIDTMTVAACLGPPLPHHQSRLCRVKFERFLQAKTKATVTHVESPLTGKQIEVKYWTKDVAGSTQAFIEIKLPLASATVGHNYLHAGLDSIKYEVRCASLLCQVVLAALGFEPVDIQNFRKTSKVKLLELSWHTKTASSKACRSLQRRTQLHCEAQGAISNLHDVGIGKTHVVNPNTAPCLLATLKSGDALRQYRKIEQVQSRSGADAKERSAKLLPKGDKELLLETIATHVRSEILAAELTLKKHRLSNPSPWNPEKLFGVIKDVLLAAGLAVRELKGEASLGPKVTSTLTQYRGGEDMRDALTVRTFSRHRQAIKEATDEDIALPYRVRAAKPGSLARQMSYERRFEPSGDLRKLVLCEVTAPEIILELERGLAFVQTGEIPTQMEAALLSAFIARWTQFVQAQDGTAPRDARRATRHRKSA